jgi:C1A family cysteine protease
VFESFESDEAARTGIIPMPKPGEQQLGGHALLCVGYDDDRESYIFQNSWGSDWGNKGFAYIPYQYMETLADDFFTLRL